VACVVRNPRTTTASSPRALWCFRWTGEWQAPDWKERPNKGNDIFDSPRGCNTWRPRKRSFWWLRVGPRRTRRKRPGRWTPFGGGAFVLLARDADSAGLALAIAICAHAQAKPARRAATRRRSGSTEVSGLPAKRRRVSCGFVGGPRGPSGQPNVEVPREHLGVSRDRRAVVRRSGAK
jgi:hypothetical protein